MEPLAKGAFSETEAEAEAEIDALGAVDARVELVSGKTFADASDKSIPS